MRWSRTDRHLHAERCSRHSYSDHGKHPVLPLRSGERRFANLSCSAVAVRWIWSIDRDERLLLLLDYHERNELKVSRSILSRTSTSMQFFRYWRNDRMYRCKWRRDPTEGRKGVIERDRCRNVAMFERWARIRPEWVLAGREGST